MIYQWEVFTAPRCAKSSAYTYYTKSLKKTRKFYIKKDVDYTVMMVNTNQPNMKERTYHGMTKNSFKERYYGHISDFKHKEKYGASLSHYIWKLKNIKSNLPENRKKNFKWSVKWEVKEKAPVYKPGMIDCKLCIAEKFHILHENDRKSLNVLSDLLSKYRHKYKWKLGRLLS